MKSAFRVQYKPLRTMGWHPVTFRSTQTEEQARQFAERLAALHPEVRIVARGGKVVWLHSQGEGTFHNPVSVHNGQRWVYAEQE